MFWKYNSIYVFNNNNSPLHDINILKTIASYYIHPFIESRENTLNEIVFNELNYAFSRLINIEHSMLHAVNVYNKNLSLLPYDDLEGYRFNIHRLEVMLYNTENSIEFLNSRKLTTCVSYKGHKIHHIILAYWNNIYNYSY